MSVVSSVLDVHDALDAASMSHAFGGALALAYVAEPRGTADVDVNVFVPISDADSVLDVLSAIGLEPEAVDEARIPTAGIRLRRSIDPSPVDVFPSIDAVRYAAIERRVATHPFGPEKRLLPFLSAEDLVLFKLSFGRDRDWVDIRAIVDAGTALDVDYIEDQLVALRGPHMHPRLARLRQLAAAH